jgi:hypothetical protein
MTTRCTICTDPRAHAIDAQLAAGRSARSLAAAFAVGVESMKRHARNHGPVPTATPPAAPGTDALDELVAALRVRALAGSDNASREYRLALQAQTDRGGTPPPYDVARDPEWVRLRDKCGGIRRTQSGPSSGAGRRGEAPTSSPSRGVVLDFGQYRGWSLLGVAQQDPAYLRWLARTPSGRSLRADIEALVGASGPPIHGAFAARRAPAR